MNYVKTVADLLNTRRHCQILGAADYVVIAEWEKEQIPLEIVIGSINHCLDFLEKTKVYEDVNSVNYFQEIIRKNFIAWLQSQAVE